MMIFDIITISFSCFFGLWLRFDFRFDTIEPNYIRIFNNEMLNEAYAFKFLSHILVNIVMALDQ